MVSVYYSSYVCEALELRAFMLSCGIPCRLVNVNDDGKKASLVNIIENGSGIPIGADPESILFSNFDREEYSSEKLRLYSRVLDVLDVKYGINPQLIISGFYRDDRGSISYYGSPLKLSATQRLLLKCLAVNPSRWCSADELASSCIVNECTHHHVAVQMDDIRRNAEAVTGKPIFETKRNSGYRLLASVRRT